MSDIELVIKIDERDYRHILQGNIVANREIIKNVFENAKLIIEADTVESDDEKK